MTNAAAIPIYPLLLFHSPEKRPMAQQKHIRLKDGIDIPQIDLSWARPSDTFDVEYPQVTA